MPIDAGPEPMRASPSVSNTADLLIRRATALQAVRGFFDARDFLEIDAPIAVASPGLEAHLDAFAIEGEAGRRYLHTSPEYALKKALGAGLEQIYCVGSCFRDEPQSRTHHPEFTMIEWYTTRLDLEGLMVQAADLIAAVALTVRGDTVVRAPNGRKVDLAELEVISVREAFVQHAKIDPWGHRTADALRSAARVRGLAVPTRSADWDDVFFQIFLNAVEPRLGLDKVTVLHGYPASQAALARLDPADPTTARRFEIYAGGLELANAFDELTDVAEQRARFEADQAWRRSHGRPVPPIDEALLSAVGAMRPTVGIALGFDRLLMLVCEIDDIARVRVQPW